MSNGLDARRHSWESELNALVAEMFPDPDPFPAHLYHYTSLENTRKILSSKQIFMSDVLVMDGDKFDGRYWTNVFLPVLQHPCVPPVLRFVLSKGDIGLGEFWNLFVACFSPEENLSNQWKLYANEGGGCAIQISVPSLMNHCVGGKAYAWMPMVYDAHEQAEKAKRLVDVAISRFLRDAMTVEEADEYWKYYASFNFLKCGLRFKDPAFAAERELRVFTSITDSAIVRFRPNRKDDGKPIRYVPLHLPAGMVTGVIKGPACACPDEELIEVLCEHGYGTDVRTHRS